MRELVFLVYLFLLVIGSAVIFLLLNEYRTGSKKIENTGVCGTSITYQATSSGNLQAIKEGKTLFRNYCASCHSKDMRKKMTGPPLENSFDKWKNDTLGFRNYLAAFINLPKREEVERSKLLTPQRHPISFEKLTRLETIALIAYIDFVSGG